MLFVLKLEIITELLKEGFIGDFKEFDTGTSSRNNPDSMLVDVAAIAFRPIKVLFEARKGITRKPRSLWRCGFIELGLFVLDVLLPREMLLVLESVDFGRITGDL